MAVTNPNINIRFLGDGIKNFNKSFTWAFDEGIELPLRLKSTDGAMSIGLLGLGSKIKIIYIECENDCIINMVTSTGNNNITIGNFYIIQLGGEETLTSLSITSSTQDDQNIKIYLYTIEA